MLEFVRALRGAPAGTSAGPLAIESTGPLVMEEFVGKTHMDNPEWPTCMYMPRVINIKAADFAPELAPRFFNILVYCQ